MKHLQLIVLLTIGAASTALAQSEKKVAPSQTSVELQLIELECQLSDALVKEDAAVLDRLWSNDLVFTSQRENLERLLTGLVSPTTCGYTVTCGHAIALDRCRIPIHLHLGDPAREGRQF